MWPFEKQRDVLRIGKHAVELWGREAGTRVKRRGVTIDGSVDLRGAVQLALEGESPTRAPVDVVVEQRTQAGLRSALDVAVRRGREVDGTAVDAGLR